MHSSICFISHNDHGTLAHSLSSITLIYLPKIKPVLGHYLLRVLLSVIKALIHIHPALFCVLFAGIFTWKQEYSSTTSGYKLCVRLQKGTALALTNHQLSPWKFREGQICEMSLVGFIIQRG